MTNEEKRIAQEMYLDGKCMDEIAKEMHYCSVTISRNLPDEIKVPYRRAKKIVYPGMTKWLTANKMSVKEFADKIKGTADDKAPYTPHILMILHGKINPRKTMIDKILAVTGLTYEEAFRTEGREQ